MFQKYRQKIVPIHQCVDLWNRKLGIFSYVCLRLSADGRQPQEIGCWVSRETSKSDCEFELRVNFSALNKINLIFPNLTRIFYTRNRKGRKFGVQIYRHVRGSTWPRSHRGYFKDILLFQHDPSGYGPFKGQLFFIRISLF